MVVYTVCDENVVLQILSLPLHFRVVQSRRTGTWDDLLPLAGVV